MAVVWAKQAGTWTDDTLWAFWNEDTQQVEDYGQIPQIGDIVYCNGYVVQFTGTINIGNGTFINGENPYTNRSGGYFNYSANPGINIIGNCEQRGVGYLFRIAIGNSNAQLNITGNIYNEDAETFAIYPTWNITTTINGSLTIGNTAPVVYLNGHVSNRITINCSSLTLYGNATEIVHSNVTTSFAFVRIVTATASLPISPINVTVTAFEMIGSILLINNITFTTATITGDIIANGYVLSGTTLNINGSITYKSTSNTMGVRYTTLNILNPDTFTWRDISEPRSNPFIILTNADMDNTDQYPSPTNVKKDVPYAWGELVGQYLPDYPPETVVLKDYAYDGGEMVGTYEGGGTVQNTINVYPYKRRNH